MKPPNDLGPVLLTTEPASFLFRVERSGHTIAGMRKTILRVPLVKCSARRRSGRRFRRAFRLNLSKPYQWQRARDYLTGEYKRKAHSVIWSGPIYKLLSR